MKFSKLKMIGESGQEFTFNDTKIGRWAYKRVKSIGASSLGPLLDYLHAGSTKVMTAEDDNKSIVIFAGRIIGSSDALLPCRIVANALNYDEIEGEEWSPGSNVIRIRCDETTNELQKMNELQKELENQ